MLAGRQADLRELLGAADAARRGRGGLILIGGEPGIGKTRLAGEVVDRLRGHGFSSAWASCREDPGRRRIGDGPGFSVSSDTERGADLPMLRWTMWCRS